MTDSRRAGTRSLACRADQFTAGAPRVLVVEDSETIREMVSEALTDVGYHTDARAMVTGWKRFSTGCGPTWWCSM